MSDQTSTVDSPSAVYPDLNPGPEQGIPAEVIWVIDGDTIDVNMAGREFRIRYIGVDTPERGDFYYDEATAANRALVDGRTVLLVRDVSETDRFGRLLRYVFLEDGTFVNGELIRRGFAQTATFPPDVAHVELLADLQRQARAGGVGLWAGG